MRATVKKRGYAVGKNSTVAISGLCVAVIALSSATSVRAATLDFNSIPDGSEACSGAGTCNFVGFSYEEDGFRITNDAGDGIVSWDSTNGNFTGSKAIFPSVGTAALSLTSIEGLAFAFESIKISRLIPGSSGATSITFTGIKADGSPNVVQTLNLLEGSPLDQTFTFTGWDNLQSVSWARNSGTGRQYDDIAVSPVPIPAAAPMLACALALFGYLGFRKKEKLQA